MILPATSLTTWRRALTGASPAPATNEILDSAPPEEVTFPAAKPGDFAWPVKIVCERL